MDGTRLTQGMVRAYTENGQWTGTLLHDYLERFAEERPDHEAVVSPGRGGSRQVRLTYEALKAEADRMAAALSSLGLGRGDIISVQLPNWYEFLVMLMAVSRIGAAINGITPIYRHRELRFILGRTESKLLVIPARYRSFDYVAMVQELRSELPALQHVVVVGESAPDGIFTFDQLLHRSTGLDVAQVQGPSSANDLAQVGFTSGTTGEPKGVMHTHNTLIATARNVIEHMGIRPEQVNLVISPVGHQTGLLWGLLITLMTGGKLVFQDRWDVAEVVEVIAREAVTTLAGATPFLRDLTYAPNLTAEKVRTLKTFITAGAPIPPVVVEDAADRLGCMIHSAWGMTEYGIGTAVGLRDPQEMAAASDGRCVPGAEVRVLDEAGALTLPGVEGDLQIRGAGLFVGYYKRPDFNEKAFTPDGFLITGDKARIDAEGFVRLTGRSKDIIIRGGENIPVAEIENLLYTHPCIKDVALVAMPHDRLGEQACAFVVLKEPETALTLHEITDFLLSHKMAKQFLPERLELIPELPRTVTGKVQKFQLREGLTHKLMAEKGA